MPKKSTRKGLCQKKGQKKGGRKKEPEEQKSDCAEPKINNSTTDESGKKAGDMMSCPSKDMIVDVLSKSSSVSPFTSSAASHNCSETTDVSSAATKMVETLEMLGSSEEQSEAFQTAMQNPVFCNLVNKYIKNTSVNHHFVMRAPTPCADRKRKSRKKQAAVDSIVSSMSCSTQEEKSAVMKEVFKDEGASNAVLALGYIKKDDKVKIALGSLEQQNKVLKQASAATSKGRLTDDKSGFINSALTMTTWTPPETAATKKVKKVDEIKQLDGAISRSSAYRRIKFAKMNRKNLRSGAETGVWSGNKKRKRYCKISEETVIALHKWIRDHPQVVRSPIAKDTLYIK